jgi:tetratricopeptide (TPR) repeat protein
MLLGSALAVNVQAQEAACSDDQNDHAMNYSLYYEDYKNDNFETSLPYLKWILRCVPGFPGNNDRNYRRAVEVYEGIGLAQDEPETMRAYLDSALYVYDTAVTNLQDAGVEVDPYSWIFQKGRFIQNHAEQLPDLQGGVGAIYREAFEMEPLKIASYYINYIVLDLVSKDDKAGAVEFLAEAEELRADDAEVLTLITGWRGRLFTSPEERIGFLEDQLVKNPEDKELVIELFELYQDEEDRDRVYELAPKMLEMDPSARTFRLIGKMRLEDGQTDQAIELYEESLTMEGGTEAAREVYYNIGTAHQQEGRLSRARTAYRQALQADPNFGMALMAIGDLYVSAVQGCGSFEREDRAVYWLAADYYDRAAARDATIASQARNRASGIRRFMPSAEDKFFKGWTAGDSYPVNYGCYSWMGETTRVR